MPVDERTFAAEVAGWVTQYLDENRHLPFGRATVEEHVEGTTKRHDFRLYRRHTDQPVLTGEVKMPDSAQGRHPLDAELVEDALQKAFLAGVQYCFTWNVRQFALFDSLRPGIPLAQRNIEGPLDVVDISISDDVKRQWVQEGIKDFWRGFLERFAALLGGRRSFEPAPIDQRFIGLLEGALENPVLHTADALWDKWQSDPGFKATLNSWMLAQGWEPSSQPEQQKQNLDRAARLSCYILVTRLVFYQVLCRRFKMMSPISTGGAETPGHLFDVFDARFGEAVQYSRDYETVFTPDKGDLGYTIPFLAPSAPDDWGRLVKRIEEFDFSTLDFEVIGQMYERLIGSSERRRFGQFYTSPDVVDLINAFCIRNPHDRVLDPACGGGTFLVRAYYRKRALSGITTDSSETHERLLDEIFGIDIGAFPAQLSTINLAVRHLSDRGNYPRVAKSSFFDAQAGIPLYDIPLTGNSTRNIALENIDAVVGNPPYIRQEGIGSGNKTSYAQLFHNEWPGQTPLRGRSDIYAYFFAHAAHLLRPGGYLGFVTSTGWLDTDYGFRLQEFFLRNFRIVAIIESEVEKWFEDARVTTAVTILQREPDAAKRNSNHVRFIQLRKPLGEIYSATLNRPLDGEGEAARQQDMDAIRDLIEEITDAAATDYWRVRLRTQRELWNEGTTLRSEDGTRKEDESPPYKAGKWGQYVRAPDSWFELIDHVGDRMTRLQDLATIRRGFTSGADKFYCVRDVTQHHLDSIPDPQEFLNRWGISREDTSRVRIVRDGVNVEHLVESRFIEPELHSLMEVKRAIVRSGDAGRKVVNATIPRARIRKTHFGEYVTYAEQQGWHTGSTIASRARTRPWYDLGLRPKPERADMFWSMSQQYRHIVPLNESLLPANHNLFEMWALDRAHVDLLWAILNSTITVISKHQFGRVAGIEGNLKTEVVDANMMLVPDVRYAPKEAAARAIAACKHMSRRNAQRYLYEEFELEDRRELDDATFQILGVEDAEVRTALRDMLYRDVMALQKSTRELEIKAQQDKRRSARRGTVTPQDIAEELWSEHESDLGLLEFPDDFVTRLNEGELIDLPPGEVQVGTAMIDVGNLLRAGTIRVGGQAGEVIEVGTVSRGRFMEALSLCHHSGLVRLPDDGVCEETVNTFTQYRQDLEERGRKLARERTPDDQRQRAVVNALMRKVLQWRRT